MMQKDQLSGVFDRVLAVALTWLLTWLATKGYITQGQVAELLPALVILLTAAWGWWVNRDKALIQSASNVPGTVVVTTPELAKATPSERNIISSKSSKETIAATVATNAETKQP